MNLSPYQPPRNTHLLKSFAITEELFPRIEEIVANCTKLVELKIGNIPQYCLNADGSIWDGSTAISDELLLHEPDDSDDEDVHSHNEEEYELDLKLLASNLHELKSLHIGSGLEFSRQPVAPPTLEQLLQLETLSLCPIEGRILCDTSRDEWNLRVLAQSSRQLKTLDLRGCYLRILSLGWLKTEILQSLHMFYQVPAASVLAKWSNSLKYLTLARVSARYKSYRSYGPERPGEELDACLSVMAKSEQSKLEQLDLRGSDCTLAPLRQLISKCRLLVYLDTRDCAELPSQLRDQFKSSTEILERFA